MEDKEIALRRKAEIICSGKLLVPRDIRIPFPISKSSAGPGAGKDSVVISFSGMRVKVPISRTEGNLELRCKGDSFEILRDGRLFLSNISLIPTLCHAPGQAFVTLDRSCKMNCLFCTMNDSASQSKGEITVDEAYRLILSASRRPDFESVSITSGISTTVQEQVDRMCTLVRKVRKSFPSIPVGVEPLVNSRRQVAMLRSAGATEIKINLEAATRDIFDKVCPSRDYIGTIAAIEWAVEEFGKNRVTSNIIIGLGESENDVCRSVDMLARIGSVANLRVIRIDDRNRDRLIRALGAAIGMDENRLFRLSNQQREIFRRHALRPEAFRTMCFPCGCCDIVPGIDF